MLPKYVAESEKVHVLPKLPSSGVKTSGPMQFFGILSAYAFGNLPREVVVEQLSIRLLNGILWRADRKDDRVTLPYTGKRPSSFSPDFALAAITEWTLWAGEEWQDAVDVSDELDDDN